MKTKNEIMKDLQKVLNKKIVIQKLSAKTQDKDGFEEEIWEEYMAIWSSVNNLFGKEFYAAKAIQAENTVEFTIRYCKELEELDSKNYRINFNNKVYDITFVDNIKYENKFIKIKAIQL